MYGNRACRLLFEYLLVVLRSQLHENNNKNNNKSFTVTNDETLTHQGSNNHQVVTKKLSIMANGYLLHNLEFVFVHFGSII